MTDKEKKDAVIWHFQRGLDAAKKYLDQQKDNVRGCFADIEIERRVEQRIRQYDDDNYGPGGLGYSFQSPLKNAELVYETAKLYEAKQQQNYDSWKEILDYVTEKL